MSHPLYRGDVVELPDDYIRPKGSRCRWYAFIGAATCDICGGRSSAHDGDLRAPEGAGPFSRKNEGRIWSDEIRAQWTAHGLSIPPRVPDDCSYQTEWVEWLTDPLDAARGDGPVTGEAGRRPC